MLEFFDIPKSRLIQLAPEKVRKYGYKTSKTIFFEANVPVGECFKLIKHSSYETFNPTRITQKYRVRMPSNLAWPMRYAIDYGEDAIYIYLK